jgi:hypothetical protein
MQYVFVAYVYDLNTIIVHAMPSKNNGAMIAVFTAILANLIVCRYAPTLNIMDNKCSKAIKAHIPSNNMDIHLVPPHNHRVNTAIFALATVDKNCLLKIWNNFLPQVELTLNLL